MSKKESLKTIMDLEKLHTTPQCPACGRDFTMGETVVAARGNWGGSVRLVHEEDAVFDEQSGAWVVKKDLSRRES